MRRPTGGSRGFVVGRNLVGSVEQRSGSILRRFRLHEHVGQLATLRAGIDDAIDAALRRIQKPGYELLRYLHVAIALPRQSIEVKAESPVLGARFPLDDDASALSKDAERRDEGPSRDDQASAIRHRAPVTGLVGIEAVRDPGHGGRQWDSDAAREGVVLPDCAENRRRIVAEEVQRIAEGRAPTEVVDGDGPCVEERDLIRWVGIRRVGESIGWERTARHRE